MSEQARPIVACPECATKVRLPANIAPGDELACPNCSAEIPRDIPQPTTTDGPKTVLPPPLQRAVKLDLDELVVRDSAAVPAAFDNDEHAGPDFDHPEKLASTDDEAFATDEQEEPRQRIMRQDKRRQIVSWDEDSTDEEPDSGGPPPVAAAASLKFILMAAPFVIAAIVFAIFARPKKLDKIPAPLGDEQVDAAPGNGLLAAAPPADIPGVTEILQTFSSDLLHARAKEQLEQFLNADGIEDRLRHCRVRERVRPLMEHYYSNHDAGPIAFREIKDREEIGNFVFLDVEMEDFSNRPAVLTPNDHLDGFEVDWETFVGYSEMSLRQLTAEKPTTPVLMRLLANPVDYFNFGFTEETHVCFLFLETHSDEHVYGYAPRDSPVADELHREFSGQSKSKYLVVRLKFPEGAKISNQVLIEEIVAIGWLIE